MVLLAGGVDGGAPLGVGDEERRVRAEEEADGGLVAVERRLYQRRLAVVCRQVDRRARTDQLLYAAELARPDGGEELVTLCLSKFEIDDS